MNASVIERTRQLLQKYSGVAAYVPLDLFKEELASSKEEAAALIAEAQKPAQPIAANVQQVQAAVALTPAYEAATESTPVPVIEQPSTAIRVSAEEATAVKAQGKPTPFDGALHVAAKHVPQFPLAPRTKIPVNSSMNDWPTLATTDLTQLNAWHAQYPDCNWASVARDGIWILDIDNREAAKTLGLPKLPKTFQVRSSPGKGHTYFRHNATSLALAQSKAYYSIKDANGKEIVSARLNHAYCVTANSVHPDTKLPYEIVNDVDLVEAPRELIDWIKQHAESDKLPVTAASDGYRVPRGSHDNELIRIAGMLREDGLEYDEIVPVLKRNVEQRFDDVGSDWEEMCEAKAKSACTYPKGIHIPVLHHGVPVETIAQAMEVLREAAMLPTVVAYDAEPEIDPPQKSVDIPVTALASSRLGDIYSTIFEPNEWPLNLALPALVTAASVLVPRFVAPEGHTIIGDDNMTNIYAALIGPVHCGKSQCMEWAAKSLGIYNAGWGEHYFDVNAGSAEQLIDGLDKRKNDFKHNVLIVQDEWSHLFAKASIPNASFAPFLTKSFYRKRQVFLRPRGKEVVLNLAMSYIGGIVEDDFDSVFNASTLGGCYDRFLFGRMPEDWKWSYRPYPEPVIPRVAAEFDPLGWSPVSVSLDGSVFELGKAWAQKEPELGRIVEICIRIATIYASMDGRQIVTGKDLEPLWGLAQYQLDLRKQFQPNAGLNPDAQFSNAAMAWIDKHAPEWTSITHLKNGVHAYEMKLGPNVAERSLYALARGGRINLWMNSGDLIKTPPPVDYTGKIPKIGLVRRAF